MISGPPGIGKSSAVKLLGEVLGYSVLGTNASE
jgi:MoxR-like ATPase